MLKLFTARFQV